MPEVFLCLGGNIGPKADNFKNALEMISEKIGTAVSASSVYESPPWGFESEFSFWNMVARVETGLTPHEILEKIHLIEDFFGRVRKPGGYLSREMDIDILYYGNLSAETPDLTIPHPLLHSRRFVLLPLAEIAPGFEHPLLNLDNQHLLEICPDKSDVKKLDARL